MDCPISIITNTHVFLTLTARWGRTTAVLLSSVGAWTSCPDSWETTHTQHTQACTVQTYSHLFCVSWTSKTHILGHKTQPDHTVSQGSTWKDYCQSFITEFCNCSPCFAIFDNSHCATMEVLWRIWCPQIFCSIKQDQKQNQPFAWKYCCDVTM